MCQLNSWSAENPNNHILPGYSRVEADEGILKFRCGRSDIEDLAFGVLCSRELGEAELRACLTHGRGELRSSREHSAKNGVKNLKGVQAISEFHIGSPMKVKK